MSDRRHSAGGGRVDGWRGGDDLRRPGCRVLAFPTQGLNPSPWRLRSVSSRPPFDPYVRFSLIRLTHVLRLVHACHRSPKTGHRRSGENRPPSGPVYFRKIVAGAVVSGGNPVGCPSPVVRPRRGTGRRGDAWSGAVHRAALSTALRGMPENAVPPRRRGSWLDGSAVLMSAPPAAPAGPAWRVVQRRARGRDRHRWRHGAAGARASGRSGRRRAG
jgi:hypothetical protein